MFIRALRKYLRIGFGTESQFIVRFYQMLSRYGDLTNQSNRRLLVEDLVQERWFARCGRRFDGFRTTPDAILADVSTPTYAGVLDAVFRQLAKHLGMQRWGDKTPEYLYQLPVLNELFPDARFIHVVRDGRDVALSGFEQAFGEKNVFAAACSWKFAMRKVEQFAHSISKERFLEVRYKDFLNNPKECFERIIPFLDIDDREGELAAFVADSVRSELKTGNTEKWRTRLSQKQIERFEHVAGDALSRYGYATSIDCPKDFNSFVKFYWRCDDFIRRIAHPGYLQDTWYRARLRLHDGLRKSPLRSMTGQ